MASKNSDAPMPGEKLGAGMASEKLGADMATSERFAAGMASERLGDGTASGADISPERASVTRQAVAAREAGAASCKRPLLLMVSGGSDSVAMVELACAWMRGEGPDDELVALFDDLGDSAGFELRALHVNHLLRGADSDADEAFALVRCEALGVPCELARVDVAAKARETKGGVEAVARAERYRAAQQALERACAQLGACDGIICTAHTLDDRVETFLMRALVGTGPGGLASIPRQRGELRRPLLDATREQLRDWLRRAHPGAPDAELWREDATNYSGENFRSQVRMELMPVLRALRPGFERSLAQTMDLIADEDEALQQEVDSLVYRSLSWDGSEARIPVQALAQASRPQARRILRSCLLVVKPDARLEAAQIDRVLDKLAVDGYATDVSGALRVRIDGDAVNIAPITPNRFT